MNRLGAVLSEFLSQLVSEPLPSLWSLWCEGAALTPL